MKAPRPGLPPRASDIGPPFHPARHPTALAAACVAPPRSPPGKWRRCAKSHSNIFLGHHVGGLHLGVHGGPWAWPVGRMASVPIGGRLEVSRGPGRAGLRLQAPLDGPLQAGRASLLPHLSGCGGLEARPKVRAQGAGHSAAPIAAAWLPRWGRGAWQEAGTFFSPVRGSGQVCWPSWVWDPLAPDGRGRPEGWARGACGIGPTKCKHAGASRSGRL